MAAIRAYTTIEQSKKLAKFLPLDTADQCFLNDGTAIKAEINSYAVAMKLWKEHYIEIIPCWSLAALMKLLPSKFTERGRYSETTYKIDIRKYALTDDVDLYQIAYGSIKFDVDGHDSFKDMINTGQKEDLLDAAFQMICWLKENNKI